MWMSSYWVILLRELPTSIGIPWPHWVGLEVVGPITVSGGFTALCGATRMSCECCRGRLLAAPRAFVQCFQVCMHLMLAGGGSSSVIFTRAVYVSSSVCLASFPIWQNVLYYVAAHPSIWQSGNAGHSGCVASSNLPEPVSYAPKPDAAHACGATISLGTRPMGRGGDLHLDTAPRFAWGCGRDSAVAAWRHIGLRHGVSP